MSNFKVSITYMKNLLPCHTEEHVEGDLKVKAQLRLGLSSLLCVCAKHQWYHDEAVVQLGQQHVGHKATQQGLSNTCAYVLLLGTFTLQPGLGLCLVRLRLGAGWCCHICYQTWIRSFTSLWLQTGHLPAIPPDRAVCSRQQTRYRWHGWRLAALSLTLEPSLAWLAAVLGWPNVNVLSRNQPTLSLEICAGVNGPLIFFFFCSI